MKKTLFIFFCLIFFSFHTALAGQNNLILFEKKTKIIFDKDIVILVTPSENTINKLKTSMGDDFYVMADDANYYSFLVFNYLKSINKPYLIKNDEAIFYFQKMADYTKYKIIIPISIGGHCYINITKENTKL